MTINNGFKVLIAGVGWLVWVLLTKALKEIDKINKMIVELEDYEREVLYPLATEQVEIDLDDGVKANYPKFGAALKKIVGLEAKED